VPGAVLQASNFRAVWPKLGTPVPDKPGHVRWANLPPGRWQVSPAAPADRPGEWAASAVRVEIEAGQTAPAVQVELLRGGVVELTFVDAESKTPISGAFAGLRGEQARSTIYVNTHGGGVSRLRLVPGEYRVRWAGADGYTYSGRDAGFTITRGKTTRLELPLKKKPRFAGVVLDPSGKPAADAMACIMPDYEYVATDKAGKFEIVKDLRRWALRKRFPLVVRLPRRDLAAAVDVAVSVEPTTVKLHPALTIVGTVTDLRGKGVPGAAVSVLMGSRDPQKLPMLSRLLTDPAGRYSIRALPPGRDYTLRISARGRMTVDVPVGKPAAGARSVQAPTAVLRRVNTRAPAPGVRRIDLPAVPDADAIWGSCGRDSRGHIWIGITIDAEVETPSTHLIEYDPVADKAYDRGDAVTQLKRSGAYRKGEGQIKIHTHIDQAADGHLYFASMDEQGEDTDAGKLPTWGSHLWRYRIKQNRWEHLMAVPEGIIALAVGRRYVYALGYFDHKLYRYDTATGKSRSVVVGAPDGHISRNIFADRRDHVYVPRVVADPGGGPPVASLVEYDPSLKPVAETPLK
ncbi:hypothetical protein LCGC14_2311620, partial [marine sediment metagenome]